MNVFIGGSRAISKLNSSIRARIEDLMQRHCTILIGDANGADKAVQQYLAERQYANVIVFCTESCRNNLGRWPSRHVEPPSDRKDFAYYSAKDSVMSREAECGFMFWDGKSKGTLQNILNLVGSGKRTLVYFAPTKDFHVLASDRDMKTLFLKCDRRDLDAAARKLGLKVSILQPRLSLFPH